jgi:DNA-binding SARP family transcriptional activator
VSLSVRLLGKPAMTRDGDAMTPPRGRKAWALLAYLLLSEHPPPRARLASLLFADADDPLGALRWSLAELRRTLDDPLSLRGDPPLLKLAPDSDVDVLNLLGAEDRAPPSQLDLGELLEGLSFPDSPAFETWLAHERRHLLGESQAVLHDAALEALAAGAPPRAAELAGRLVALDPLEQRSQELLIRCLARGGDRAGAEAQLSRCEQLFRTELGTAPGPELRRAAGETVALAQAAGDHMAAVAQLEAGRAALDAGAVEPGIECLRLASAEAAACGDQALQASALGALGSALVHAVRGRDEEGAAVLHEALALAEEAGERSAAASASRELGYIDLQAGRGAAAGRWLAKATALAQADEEVAAVLGFRGVLLSDRAHYPAALEVLERSVELAQGCGDVRQEAWSQAFVGRVHLLRGEFGPAAEALDAALAIVAGERWAAFRPWPEALRAEVALRMGSPDQAAERLEGAFRLACRLEDPCWEGTAARVTGLISAAKGDSGEGRRWLEDALSRASRVADPYEWVRGYILDALAELAIERSDDDAAAIVSALSDLAAQTGMRELLVRADIHRARLGEPGAAESARLLASEIDNPLLDEAVDRADPA